MSYECERDAEENPQISEAAKWTIKKVVTAHMRMLVKTTAHTTIVDSRYKRQMLSLFCPLGKISFSSYSIPLGNALPITSMDDILDHLGLRDVLECL